MAELTRRRMLGLLPVVITVPIMASRPVPRGDHAEVTVTTGEPEITEAGPPIVLDIHPGQPLSAENLGNAIGKYIHEYTRRNAGRYPRTL